MGQFFPDFSKFKEFREPFLGGGSVALYISKMYPSLDIWVNDLYEPLVNFWQNIQDDGQNLQDMIWSLKNKYPERDSARELFTKAKESINNEELSSRDRAAYFYVVNKCSFSGLTESSSFSAQASESNFSYRGIEKITGYQQIIENWTITNISYERMLSDDSEIFTYLDPPYDIKDNLYGKKGDMHKKFNHDEFAEWCDRFTSPMLISYNSSQLVKNRFKHWTATEFDLTYTMRSVGEYMREQQQRKELLLLNYGT